MIGLGGWHAVDLDGTLAEYHGWPADGGIGAPVPAMLTRVKEWIINGEEVRIFTARVSRMNPEVEAQRKIIEAWCRTHIGGILKVTNEKDFQMVDLWDDRAVQVEFNTGRRMDGAEG